MMETKTVREISLNFIDASFAKGKEKLSLVEYCDLSASKYVSVKEIISELETLRANCYAVNLPKKIEELIKKLKNEPSTI